MKFFYLFNKTALYMAIQKKNIEIVQLLLNKSKIDVNSTIVLI